jgi:hypothetical protein
MAEGGHQQNINKGDASLKKANIHHQAAGLFSIHNTTVEMQHQEILFKARAIIPHVSIRQATGWGHRWNFSPLSISLTLWIEYWDSKRGSIICILYICGGLREDLLIYRHPSV